MLHYKDSESVYLSYEGPFNITMIADLAKSLVNNIIASEWVQKKLYRVFIELAQNVAFYSFNRVLLSNGSIIGKGKVYITYKETGLQCSTINKIMKEHAPILIKNCMEINQSTLNELHNKKKKLREITNFNDTGAHIGLIMICLYSENPIEFEVINDNHSGDTYFKISATITNNKHQ
jgi:hypothetical protein